MARIVQTQRFGRQATRRAPRRTAPGAGRMAVMGAMLVIASLPFTIIGTLMVSRLIGAMDFRDTEDVGAIVDSISRVTQGLSSTFRWVAIGQCLNFMGAVLITYAFHWGWLRTNWFFWTTLALAALMICVPNLMIAVPDVVWIPNVGMLFGLWWLWCLLWTRDEFRFNGQSSFST